MKKIISLNENPPNSNLENGFRDGKQPLRDSETSTVENILNICDTYFPLDESVKSTLLDRLASSEGALKIILFMAAQTKEDYSILTIFRKGYLPETIQDDSGQTVFHHLVKIGNIQHLSRVLVAYLIKKAKENGFLRPDDNTVHPSEQIDAFIGALYKLNKEIFKVFDTVDDKGQTALHIAGIKGFEAIAKILLRFKADPLVSDLRGKTYMAYVEHRKETQMAVAESLRARILATSSSKKSK